jgi:acyl-CoA thioester hydrolase
MEKADTARAAAPTDRASYTLWTFDKIRFSDLDGQGHVNNAVFATYFEAGRVEYFRDPALALLTSDETCVLARMAIDFLAELRYPGTVDVGGRIAAIGRSSFTMGQALFSGTRCISTAEAVMVMIDMTTRKSKPLSPRVKAWLAEVQEQQATS